MGLARPYQEESMSSLHELLESLKSTTRELYRAQVILRKMGYAKAVARPDFDQIEKQLSAVLLPLLAELTARERNQANRELLYEEWGLHDLFIGFESLDLEEITREWDERRRRFAAAKEGH